MLEERRKQLYEVYKVWEKELKAACPQLITKKYSHPYYLHIPDNWFVAGHRILIVGEEGFGSKQFDLSIEEVQEFNRTYLAEQLGVGKKNNSGFWQRIRRIAALPDVSVTWTNLDMIHINGKECRLPKLEQTMLHQTPTAILSQEIRILEPDIVVYFGWYREPLRAEMRDELVAVFDALYPNGKPDWEPEKIRTIRHEKVCHIFTYHPGWRRKGKAYEDSVIETIKRSLSETDSK